MFTEKYTHTNTHTHTHSSKKKQEISAVVISISGANKKQLHILWMLIVGNERGWI
jgi:hypothetical protein